jgi:predicted amidohydrolase
MSDLESQVIAAVQVDVRLGDPLANRSRMLERFAEATSHGARLVVFPECALTGYGFETLAEALPFAEEIPGPTTREFQTACARTGAFALFGLLERAGDRLYNACALVGPDGVVGSYRKVHLPFMGVDRFADPGDRPFGLLDVNGMKVGILICYDGSFPEPTRVLTLLGADLVLLPTNWPRHTETAAEHLPACRALENVIYFAAINRVGEERGFRFVGGSSIAGPGGETLAKASADGEEILYATIDPARARRKRLVRIPGKHEVDRIADRRPGYYGALVREGNEIGG